jgi:tRNA U34 5-carboxymethylaminomethyl modifying enzyme MnmG/GidA
MQVTALSIEARQKLARHRPETLGMASRISGITPGEHVAVADSSEKEWSKDKGPERLNRLIRV